MQLWEDDFPDEHRLLKWIIHLNEIERAHGFITQIKGAMQTYIGSLSLPLDIWSFRVESCYKTSVKFAAHRKPRKKKAVMVPGSVLDQALRHHLVDKLHDLFQIKVTVFRGLMGEVIKYYALGRDFDISLMRACDLELTEQNGEEVIIIHFNKAKNDQNGMGFESWIAAQPEVPTCPVRLLKAYYLRNCFVFGRSHQWADMNFLFPVARITGSGGNRVQVADGTKGVNQRTVLDDAIQCYRQVGYMEKVSGKSAKMAGVSDSYEGGLDDTGVRDKGRWANTNTPLHYKVDTPAYRLELARSNSTATSGQNRLPRVVDLPALELQGLREEQPDLVVEDPGNGGPWRIIFEN